MTIRGEKTSLKETNAVHGETPRQRKRDYQRLVLGKILSWLISTLKSQTNSHKGIWLSKSIKENPRLTTSVRLIRQFVSLTEVQLCWVQQENYFCPTTTPMTEFSAFRWQTFLLRQTPTEVSL